MGAGCAKESTVVERSQPKSQRKSAAAHKSGGVLKGVKDGAGEIEGTVPREVPALQKGGPEALGQHHATVPREVPALQRG
eukprot:3558123-Rhodomonas_salina.1